MRSLFLSVFFAFLLSFQPAFADHDETAQARAYVDHVAGSALDIIAKTHKGELSDTQAKANFRAILSSAFDIPVIAKFTLGRYWRVATPQQRAEYTRLIQANILDKYADRVLEFSGDKYTIDSSRAINNKDYAVGSTIYPSDGSPVKFDWRLRRNLTKFKIIDIAVEGVSMSVTHRSDFASIIERNGGKVEALLDALRNRDIKAAE